MAKLIPVQSHFTKVPYHLLRKANFQDPLCFMVYMHLYSLSYGFNKKHCDVSLSQLEKYTGAVRNSVNRAVNALLAAGFIHVSREHTPHKLAWRYEVILIGENRQEKNSQDQNLTGLESDTVKSGQSQKMIERGSKFDPVTGSKSDPLKESTINKKELSQEVREFFETLPVGKRRREEKSYQGLREGFSEMEILNAFLLLRKKGAPQDGKPVHSPMAYLSFAMNEVLQVVRKEELGTRQRQAVEKSLHAVADGAGRTRMELETKARESFLVHFPQEESRSEIVNSFLKKSAFSRFIPREIVEKEAVVSWYRSSGISA